jgi:hypothetical protein
MKKMKKLMNRGLLAIFAALFVLSACGKYEGGPGFSLASKKGRLTGTWDATSIEYSNGNVVTIDAGTNLLTFDKDGTYKNENPFFGATGNWEFNDDKTAIVVTINGNSETSDPIYRLTNKDLWFKNADGDINKYTKK